jgi:hypothetical protein
MHDLITKASPANFSPLFIMAFTVLPWLDWSALVSQCSGFRCCVQVWRAMSYEIILLLSRIRFQPETSSTIRNRLAKCVPPYRPVLSELAFPHLHSSSNYIL